MNTPRKIVYIGGSGYAYAMYTSNGEIAWELQLKLGWLKTGNNFVNIMSDGIFLCAFAYGIFYKLKNPTAQLCAKEKKLKN